MATRPHPCRFARRSKCSRPAACSPRCSVARIRRADPARFLIAQARISPPGDDGVRYNPPRTRWIGRTNEAASGDNGKTWRYVGGSAGSPRRRELN